MNINQAANLTSYESWFRYHMPYQLQPLDNGIYLPVNRDYKPLGMITRDYVDYTPYAITHGMMFARDPRTYTDVWHSPSEILSFYNDDPKTLTTYFERLDRLMRRSVKIANTDAVKAMNRFIA